jgi:putative membrane protein
VTDLIHAIPYDLLRGLHLLAVIAWMAGLLMLPRLFAYHAEAARGGELELKMTEGARRVMAVILNPAMIATWVLGLAMLWARGWETAMQPWMVAKLVLVLALSGYHGMLAGARRRFAAGERPGSSRRWRMLNEVPFLIAIAVVLLVTLEPTF